MLRSLNFFFKFYTYFWNYLNIFSYNLIVFLFLPIKIFNFKLFCFKQNLKTIQLKYKYFLNFSNFLKIKFSKKSLFFFKSSNLLLLLNIVEINKISNLLKNWKFINIIGFYFQGFFLNIYNSILIKNFINIIYNYTNKSLFFKKLFNFLIINLFFNLFFYIKLLKSKIIFFMFKLNQNKKLL